jgi:1-acyl-sn-glycerol-3-phosphate acyltransferase
MKKILQILSSVYFWFELFFLSFLLFPFAALIFLSTVLFDPGMRIQHMYACFWSWLVLKANFMWKAKVEGRELIDRKETYVMVCNHQSGADIIVTYLLWVHFKWVAKRSLYYIPFIGWNMLLNRYITVDRNSKSSMKRMMSKASEYLNSGNSVMIFPEGTRSKDGKLQAFKTGAFHLALENRKPILPIVISGTSRAIRKGGFLINRNSDILVKVLPPLPFQQFCGKDPKEVTAMVREIMAAESDRPVK